MRLIDADEVLAKVKKIKERESQVYGRHLSHFAEMYLNAVKDAKAVETGGQPGEWIRKWKTEQGAVFQCSGCMSTFTVDDGEMDFEFCPYCGSDMREES